MLLAGGFRNWSTYSVVPLLREIDAWEQSFCIHCDYFSTHYLSVLGLTIVHVSNKWGPGQSFAKYFTFGVLDFGIAHDVSLLSVSVGYYYSSTPYLNDAVE